MQTPQSLDSVDPVAAARDQRLADALAAIRTKLVVMSGKGGVGKSTVAAYLALGLAARGNQVGLMDVDLHGPSIPRILGLEGHATVNEDEGVIVPTPYGPRLRAISVEMLMPDKEASVIWRGPLKIGVIRQFLSDVVWGALDYLVIDSPPGTGDEPLTVAQSVDGALAVIVTTPQELALADVRKSLDFCRQMEMPVLGLVENLAGLSCPHCGEPVPLLGSGGGEQTAKRYGVPFLGSLPMDPRLVKAADQGRPLDLADEDQGLGAAFAQVLDKVVDKSRKGD